MAISESSPSHPWRFFRTGGFDQVQLDTGADLMALDQLDQKLWVALACPTRGLEFDSKTLDLIDTDKDGRVRAPELIAAVKWAGGLLKNPHDLIPGAAALPLASINDALPEGKTVLTSARLILANLGRKDATTISLDDTADTAKIFAQTVFNGDGIIVAESATDDATRAVINDIIATYGPVADRSGKPGIDPAKVDAFFADATAFSEWVKKSEADATAILPLGAGTAAASAALQAVRAKVDDYFGRCRLAAFDPRALGAVNREEKEYLALAAKDMTLSAAEAAGFPLATIAAGKPLPLKTGINPAWADAIAAFCSAAVKPLLGDRTELTESDWATLRGKLAAHDAWMAARAGAAVEKLGAPRLREILASPAKASLDGLIAKDKAEEGSANAIATVEKLIRYHRDLHRLCVNFVSFRDFFDGCEAAIFQVGTLYLDQRSCGLCLMVTDAARHGTMAALAGTYLAYCDCTRKGGEKMQIVAAFTDGDSESLMIGRNGVFYDRKGQDWDATITKIIDNPISIRQAFWSPYKKFVRMIEEQVAKRAAAADAAATAKLQSAATTVSEADKAKLAKPPEPKKVDVGTVAAMGVAFGAIGSFMTAVWMNAMGIIQMGPLAIAGALVGVLLLISGPSMIIAWLKLRKRSIGPLLDANGWAVNARVRVNVPFGASLTAVAKLPPGAVLNPTDPFAEKKSPWPKLIVIAFVLWIAYREIDWKGVFNSCAVCFSGSKPAAVQTNAPAPAGAVTAPVEAPAKAP